MWTTTEPDNDGFYFVRPVGGTAVDMISRITVSGQVYINLVPAGFLDLSGYEFSGPLVPPP